MVKDSIRTIKTNYYMKKSISKAAVCFILLFSLAISIFKPIKIQAATSREIRDGKIIKKILKYYKKGNIKKANKYNKKISIRANESCVKIMSSGMKKAYKKIIKKYNSTIWEYYYTDFNNDGKANLIIQAGKGEADVKFIFFKYSGGTAKKIGSTYASTSIISAYPNHNGVVIVRGHMGEESVRLVYQKNGKVKAKTIGTRSDVLNYFGVRCILKSHIS